MNTNKYGQPVGFPLSDWQPAPFPARIQLSGHHCNLLPLEICHCGDLLEAFSQAPDDRDWTWLGAEQPTCLEQMQLWVENKINDPGVVAWAVVEIHSGFAVGVVCYSNIDVVNGAIEIGHVTWSRKMQRTAMGTEALFLLLRNAFSLGYRRVAWRCDSHNLASRNAAERLGFTFEGRFRQAMTRKQRNRDTDWLSIIDIEWPTVKHSLLGWLSPGNFTSSGMQKRRLESFRNSQ